MRRIGPASKLLMKRDSHSTRIQDRFSRMRLGFLAWHHGAHESPGTIQVSLPIVVYMSLIFSLFFLLGPASLAFVMELPSRLDLFGLNIASLFSEAYDE